MRFQRLGLTVPLVVVSWLLSETAASHLAAAETAVSRLYLVGIGPGAPDLATLRAVDTMKKADLVFCSDKVWKTFAQYLQGKQSGGGGYWRLFPFYGKDPAELPEPQRAEAQALAAKRAEFIAKVREAIAEGKTVAILDSGDPMIYGPWEWCLEEFEDLHPVVVPGVSSFNAGNAALGKGVTTSDRTKAVILTSTDWPGKTDTIEQLSKQRSTMVIFTMRSEFPEFIRKLSVNYPPDTPVAIVEHAGDLGPTERDSGDAADDRLASRPRETAVRVSDLRGRLPRPSLQEGHRVDGTSPSSRPASHSQLAIDLFDHLGVDLLEFLAGAGHQGEVGQLGDAARDAVRQARAAGRPPARRTPAIGGRLGRAACSELLRIGRLPRLHVDPQFRQIQQPLVQPRHPFVAAGQHERQPRLGRRIEAGQPGHVLQHFGVGPIGVVQQHDGIELLIAILDQPIGHRPPQRGQRRRRIEAQSPAGRQQPEHFGRLDAQQAQFGHRPVACGEAARQTPPTTATCRCPRVRPATPADAAGGPGIEPGQRLFVRRALVEELRIQ